MKRQSAGEALGNFGRILVKTLLVIFVFYIVIDFQSDKSGDPSPTTDRVVDVSGITNAEATESNVDKTESAEVSLSFFRDNEEAKVTTETPNSIFYLVDAYLEDDHLILVFDFENLSSESVEPWDAYKRFIDDITQEDDNAIYDVDINHFYDLMGQKETQKISSGNPKIKPNGKFTFYVPYMLENESPVTINLKNGTYPIVITLD